ncbi:hypothetical protein RND81_03G232800 [Saponaria officinalis]|uniref:Exostosin GT47 domain-containing protein n=1 Tax=Saponaria officinalis TaxID=3572 RepID=A0AAW1M8Q7_SAPOF
MVVVSSSSSSSSSSYLPCSIRTLFTLFSILFTLTLSSFLYLNKPTSNPSSIPQNTLQNPKTSLKVFIFDLPRSYNYELLEKYWTQQPVDPNNQPGSTQLPQNMDYPPLPDNLSLEQHSAEYWLLGDLMTPEISRNGSFAKRVYNETESDVIFVPFFAAVSCVMQVGLDRRVFTEKVESNEDYKRQKEVIELVTNSDGWKRSGGRDHVFVVADPMAMWHVKHEIAPAILLVVDFGGWTLLDSEAYDVKSPERIQHTQVSLIKDVIVPYNHLLPTLHLSEDKFRHNLLYFRGGKNRQRGGIIRAKLWDLLVNEAGVIMEEGTATPLGRQQSVIGMRSTEFCLNPAGDTPASCRLFDAIQSLCIPVIVSDQIELPFEGMIDYSEFSIFVSADNALQPKWLVSHLRSISKKQIDEYRKNLARVQPMFVYDYGHPGGIGPVPKNSAVNQIWRKVHQKVPIIKEAVTRYRRRPPGVLVPLRCQCT